MLALIHLVVGILAAVCGIVCADVLHLNPFFTAALIYAFLMLITGYNHLDGVMDMADGVMVHGDPQRKISVMKDSSVGAGGVATLFLVAVLTIAGLYNVLDYECIAAIIICEMVSKSSIFNNSFAFNSFGSGYWVLLYLFNKYIELYTFYSYCSSYCLFGW